MSSLTESTVQPADPSASAAPPPPAAPGRRERSITVETEGLGQLKVRRVSLGGIARCADRLRAGASTDDDALLDALITEVAGLGGESGTGWRRRLGAEQIGRLTDTDRRSIAAAVLTLEGVKAAGEGVVRDPLASLADRYGPMVGLGERARRPAAPIELDPTPPAAEEASGPQVPAGHLHEQGGDAAGTAGAEPQIPLFDPAQVPPANAHRLPEHDAVAAPGTRAARAAAEKARAHIEHELDAQQHALLGVADDHRALAAEVAALAARAERAETAARRNRWMAVGAVAVAAVLAIAQTIAGANLRRDLHAQQQQLQEQLRQQGEVLRDLRAQLAARGERAASPRAPAPAATAPARARTDSGGRAR